jgi:hypothetical protein
MSSQFKFNWSQIKFLNLIFNCIKKKNRGTSSIQFNFLIHQLTVYTVQKDDLLGWIEPAVKVDGGVDVWAVIPHHVQHGHLQRPAHSKPLWLSLKLWRRPFLQPNSRCTQNRTSRCSLSRRNMSLRFIVLKGCVLGIFSLYIRHSTLLRLPPLRFHCAGGY